jgi:hypothetical protein
VVSQKTPSCDRNYRCLSLEARTQLRPPRQRLSSNAHIVIYFWALWPEVAGSVFARTCEVLDSVIPTNTHRETAGKPTSSRDGYNNGYNDEKEGQPVRAGLLVSPLL